MTYELTVIPALLLTTIVFLNLYFCHERFHDVRITIVGVLLCIQILFQITFPALYGFLEGYPWESYYQILPEHYVIVYIIELLSVSFWLIGFYAFRPFYRKLSKWSIIHRPPSGIVDNLLFLYVILFALIMMISLSSGLSSYGDMVAYDAQNLGENVMLFPTSITIPKTIWVIVKSLFFLPGILAGGILASRPMPGRSRYRLIGWAVIIFLLVYGLVVGLRQFILGAVLILFIFGFSQGNRRVLKPMAVGLVILVLLAPVIGSEYREALTKPEAREWGMMKRLSFVYQMRSMQEKGNFIGDFWHAAGSRLIDPLVSAGLVKATLRGESAGLKPLFSSFVAPIPRFLWPNKPAPGSSDGTNEGLATFVVWRETIGRTWGLCGGFTTGSHAFWELNIIGVILFGIFGGLFARSILEATRHAGDIGLMIWVLSMKPFAFSVHLWTPEIIRIGLQIILPVIIIYKCWSWLLKKRCETIGRPTGYEYSDGRSL